MMIYTDALNDPKLVAAAKRIWDDHYMFERKMKWEDLPDFVDPGTINNKALCLSHAWSVFEALGMNRCL